MVAQKITRLRALDNERESIHKQKMKGSTKFKFGLHVFLTTQIGFLNKAKKKGTFLSDDPTPID